MSLKVWLPLNGNLNNQGLTDITVINNGSTVDNNGKIGKCYSFNGSSQYLRINEKLIDNAQYTISFWMYATNVSANHCIFSTRNVNNGAVNIYLLSTGLRFDNGINWITGFKPTVNTWYHIAFVQDTTNVYLYINGILNSSTSATTTLSQISSIATIGCEHINGSSIGTYFAGKLNDFRIWNGKALSPKEIEILSRGLVCHYPLNGGGRTNNNMISGTHRSDFSTTSTSVSDGKLCVGSGGNGTFSITTDTTCPVGKYSYNVLNNTVGNRDFQQANIPYVTGKKYTGSWWAKGSGACLYRVWNVTKGTQEMGVTFTLTSEWKHYSHTFTATQNMGTDNCTFHLGVTGASSINICGMKLEEGEQATPWMPNPVDDVYAMMGYDSTTEYDVSGYGNNMTKTGTITYTTDSIRYNVAPHFINGSYLMANQNSPEYLPKDSLTVNLWVKPSTWNTPISCTEGGGWNFESSPVQFSCYISGVGYKTASSGVTSASLQNGKWHMLTGSYNNISQELKIYIDGVLKGTTATDSSNGVGYANNRLIISGEAQTTTPNSSYYVGEESDVRIYATALSDTQVADLYNTAVSVANNGTLMGYELVEG